MTKKEYKENFKMIPERAWLSSSIRSLRTDQGIEEIVQLLSGEKDINTIDDSAELYRIRFQFSQLSMYASKCVELINKMKLDGFGEFEDVQMELKELDISKTDVFECIETFNLLNTFEIEAGSEIKVLNFQNMGSKSQFACEFINWIRNENMKKLFPDGYNKMFIVPVKDMETYFRKK